MHWTELPRAPAIGTALCRVDALQSNASASFDLAGFPVLVINTARGLFAYHNACPHQYLPLDWRSERVLSADSESLLCSNHSAEFDLVTGAGTGGFAKGCQLTAVPVAIDGEHIVIGTTAT